MKSTSRQFALFVILGGINSGLTYLLYVLLLLFLPYWMAYTGSYVGGIFISYALNSWLVFRQKIQLTKAIKYPIVYVTQYLVGIIVLRVLVDVLKIDQLIAPWLIVLITLPMTFLFSRRIIGSNVSI